jgi:hypothetical protein
MTCIRHAAGQGLALRIGHNLAWALTFNNPVEAIGAARAARLDGMVLSGFGDGAVEPAGIAARAETAGDARIPQSLAMRRATRWTLRRVADMVSCAIEGAIVLSRGVGEPKMLSEQILMLRSYIRLLFA